MATISGSSSPVKSTYKPEPKPKADPPKAAPKPQQAQAKPEPQQSKDSFEASKAPKNEVKPGSTKNFSSGAQNDIQHFANSSKGEVSANRDGSVTRTSSSTRGQTTRTQELTTDKGPLGGSNLKYATTSKTGGTEVNNTYTAKSGVLGTQSSHEREATSQRGNQTQTKTSTESHDVLGIQKNTRAEGRGVTDGDTTRTQTASSTTDSLGNRAQSQKATSVTTQGNTTVTRTTEQSSGSELTTTSSQTLEEGKASLGVSGDWKNDRFNTQRSYDKELQVRPSTADSGFSQARQDRVGTAQSAGTLLGEAGARAEVLSGEVPKDKMVENNLSTDPNSFVGSRVGYSGSHSVTVGADGVNAKFNREAKAGVYAETKGATSGQYGEASYEANAKAEAAARVDAQGKLDTNGLDASVNMSAGVSAEASVTGTAQTQSVKVAGVDVNASVTGKATASAEAKAEATGNVQVTRNPPTAIAEGTVGASAVAKVEGEVEAAAGPFSVNASAYASAGAEAKASGVIGYEDGKLKLGGSVGAALGLGAGGAVNVEVDVAQIGEMAKNTAVSVADANNDGKLGFDDAKAVVDNTADKVMGWLGF